MPATEPMAFDEYGSERDRIKRALAEAAALREKHQPSKGGMVGPLYVRPSKLSGIAGLAGQAFGAWQGRKAQEDQTALDQRMGDDYSSWMAQRPQSKMVGTPEEIEGTVAPGPMPEGMEGTPLAKTRLRMEKVEPTQAETINWASKGMRNPLSKALASHYMEDAIVKQPEREAQRLFKAEEAEKARAGKLEADIARGKQKMGELELMEKGKDATREQVLFIEKMKDATRREMNANDAKARVLAAEAKAKAAGQVVKPVPFNVTNKMSEAETASENINNAFAGYKPEYSGYQAAAGGAWAKVVPSMLSTDDQKSTAAWWQNYNRQVNLADRHDMFGATFSGIEKQAWKDATITPTTPPELAAKYLQIQSELATKHYNQLRKQFVTTGYGAIAEAFPELGVGMRQEQGMTPLEPTSVPAQRTQNPPPMAQPMPGTAPQSRRKGDLPPGWSMERVQE